MINVLVLWLVLAATLIGWGLLAIWLLRRSAPAFGGALSAFQTLWLGYAALVCFLQLVSFVLPIRDAVLAVSLVPAVVGFALERRQVARRIQTLRRRSRQLVVIAIVGLLACVVVDYVACDLVRWYDTGLYHLQMVKWNATYSVVPGLANLHMRFGYNNSVHLFGAYVDAYWEGMSAHVTNGFFLATILVQWFAEIFGAHTPRGRLRQVFCLLSLPFLLSRLWTIEPSSLGSDLPTAALAFALVLEVVSLPPRSRDRELLPIAQMLALAAVLLSTKLGGMSLFGVFALYALWRMRARGWRVVLRAVLLPTLIVVGWVARGIALSGWLLYPVFGRLPLGWAVPESLASYDLGNIKSWSRVWGKGPDEVFGHGFWHWFAPWLDSFRLSHEFVLLVISFALLAWRATNGNPRQPGRQTGLWLATTMAALGILQWFLGAPDLRYGAFLFWLLAAVVAAPMLAASARNVGTRPLVLALSLLLCVWGGGFAFRVNERQPKLWGRLPAPQTVDVRLTPLGPDVDVRVPTVGDQCFDAPLPCSPIPHARLRHAGSISAGFAPAP